MAEPGVSATTAKNAMISGHFSDDFDCLVFEDVSRYFGRMRALSHVSFSCTAGEIVGVLGPNGAGKSTLLALASTLITPSAGGIRYGNQGTHERGGNVRANIGMLSHDTQLYPELTARENLQFFAGLFGVQDPASCTEAALSRSALRGRGDEPVMKFSRGMRQRLALERALIHDPKLVLLDEPFTGLDDSSSKSLANRLRGLRENGRIILLTTHDFEAAEGLLDRAALLWDGELLNVEPVIGSLRDHYVNHTRKVAGTAKVSR